MLVIWERCLYYKRRDAILQCSSDTWSEIESIRTRRDELRIVDEWDGCSSSSWLMFLSGIAICVNSLKGHGKVYHTWDRSTESYLCKSQWGHLCDMWGKTVSKQKLTYLFSCTTHAGSEGETGYLVVVVGQVHYEIDHHWEWICVLDIDTPMIVEKYWSTEPKDKRILRYSAVTLVFQRSNILQST